MKEIKNAKELCAEIEKIKEEDKEADLREAIRCVLNRRGSCRFFRTDWFYPKESTIAELEALGYKVEHGHEEYNVYAGHWLFWEKIVKKSKSYVKVSACCEK